MNRRVAARLLALLPFSSLGSPLRASEKSRDLATFGFDLFSRRAATRTRALSALAASGMREVAPILVMALRFAPSDESSQIVSALEKLTGARPGKDWNDWMVWQEQNDVGTIDGFARLQSRVFELIDPEFRLFLDGDKKHEIRLEEIVWGGVRKDGIPALTNPKLVSATAATYLGADDLVFGVAVGDDVRAYPLRILDWHEMFNDVVGGVPLSLAYCTLCGSGILFETRVEGRKDPFVFGSSGFLYRSNKLMYDVETHSLWNQFTGRPVVGPLTGSGIELKTRPVTIASWSDWKARNPGTTVLSLETGHRRDYRPGKPYGDYFASPDLMFPTAVGDKRLRPKDFVFALRSSGTEVAWPLSLFEGGAVINDKAGILDLVLIGDARSRTVRAYRSDGLEFATGAAADVVVAAGETWRVTEDALVSPTGRNLARLPGHIAFWFAWSGYMGPKGTLRRGQPGGVAR